jgi:hypothetical protein
MGVDIDYKTCSDEELQHAASAQATRSSGLFVGLAVIMAIIMPVEMKPLALLMPLAWLYYPMKYGYEIQKEQMMRKGKK